MVCLLTVQYIAPKILGFSRYNSLVRFVGFNFHERRLDNHKRAQDPTCTCIVRSRKFHVDKFGGHGGHLPSAIQSLVRLIVFKQ